MVFLKNLFAQKDWEICGGDIGDDSQIIKYRKYELQMNRIRELFGV